MNFMKRLLPAAFFLLHVTVAWTQTVPDAKKLMYYERFIGASYFLHDLLKTDPNNSEAWYLLTRCSIKAGRLRPMEDSLDLVPTEINKSPWIDCARGALILRLKNKANAEPFFKAALLNVKEKDPAVLAAVALAHVESDSGDLNTAVALLTKAIKMDKANPSYWIDLGDAYRKLQNGGEAFKAYTRSLELDGGNAMALYRMGILFVSQNNPEMFLKYFNQAVKTDSLYGPAWYSLYLYYYYRDPGTAINDLKHYVAVSDLDPENNYRLTDLLYLSKQYALAVEKAKQLIGNDKDSLSDHRLFKLLAYSHEALNDTVSALNYMRLYFKNKPDSACLTHDFEFMGDLFSRFPYKLDSGAMYYAKAMEYEKDSVKKTQDYKTIIKLYKKTRDYGNQALWEGRYFRSHSRTTNLDLFNWGISEYLAGNYKNADSVFGMYAIRYPDQTFGYYWKARSDAALDSGMEYGLAIPAYDSLIELTVKEKPENQNKKWLIEAYGYIAAYFANTRKDYTGATDYLEKILTLDPQNENAKKYIGIIKKNTSNLSKIR